MTSRYVAFLRGINVGGHRVKMDRLRSLFEELGLVDVSTFIASGNMIFSTSEAPFVLEAQIEKRLRTGLGYDVATFIRSSRELEVITGLEPFPGARDRPNVSHHVMFLREPPANAAKRTLTALETADDRLHLEGRELYWLRRGSLLESALDPNEIARSLGRADHTMRNMNTIRRLAAKFFQ